jgi:hypothetical protein
MVNEDATKDELQEELRRRDLPVSGSKSELQQRLREDDRPAKKATKKGAAKKSAKKATKKGAAKKSAKKATKKSAAKKATKKSAAKKSAAKKQGTSGEQAASDRQEPAREEVERTPQQDRERGGDDAARSGQRAPSGPSQRRGTSERPGAGEIARLAARQLAALTRRKVEAIAGLSRDEGGWRVEVEVLEVARIPPTTDVVGIYAVWVDGDGDLVSYERVERFIRGQASSGEGSS